MKSMLLQHRLTAVQALMSEAVGRDVEILHLPDPDPAECGLLVSETKSERIGDVNNAAKVLRTPARLYLRWTVLWRMLDTGPDRLVLAMEILGIDRLIIFGLSPSDFGAPASASEEVKRDLSELVQRLRSLGFRSPRMAIPEIAHSAIEPVAISFIYVLTQAV